MQTCTYPFNRQSTTVALRADSMYRKICCSQKKYYTIYKKKTLIRVKETCIFSLQSASLSHSLWPNVNATNVCKIIFGLTLAKEIGHNFNPKLRYQHSAYQR